MPIGTFATGTRAIGESTDAAATAIIPPIRPAGIPAGGPGTPFLRNPAQTLVVGAGSPAGGVGLPYAREPVHMAATAVVTGSATGMLGLLTPLDGSVSFSVSITGVLFKPPLIATIKAKVTLRGVLRVPALVIPPPDGVIVPSLKRISIIMPTPVLDANGLPT